MSFLEIVKKNKIVRLAKLLLQTIKIPGFKGLSLYDLLHMYLKGIIYGAFSTRASGISFSAFLAIFPFLLFLLNLIPYIPIENFQQEFISFLNELLPPKTSVFFDSIIVDIVKNKRGGLLSSTFFLAIFLMTNGINAVFSGFDNSYHNDFSYSLIKQYWVALGVAIILALFLFCTVYVTVYFSYLVNTYERIFIGDAIFWLKFGRIGFYIVMVFFTIATLFYFGTKDGRGVSFFSPGAVLTTFLILVTTYLFGFYIDNFSRYNEIYGSIGALLILMLYIYVNSNLVLLGYELNATLAKLKRSTK